MLNNDAAITVVIPVWDSYVGPALLEAIESVRRQSVTAQIVVVDNASDVALEALGPISVVRCPTRVSTGEARNIGLEQVTTPYVVFLDADDLLLAGALEHMLALARRRPDAVVWSLSILDGTSGARHRSPRRLAFALSRLPGVFAAVNAVWSLLPTQGAALLHTETVRRVGGYDPSERGGDDWPLCALLAFQGRVVFSPTPALVYRWRPASPGGPLQPRELIAANAARVRRRLVASPHLPRWTRGILPALAICHAAVIYAVRPTVLGARRLYPKGFRSASARSTTGPRPEPGPETVARKGVL